MGRIISLIFSLSGVFVTSAAGTWWFNTVAIGLLLRWLEGYRVIRQGSIHACLWILFTVWIVFSAITIGIVAGVFILLRAMLSEWLAKTLPEPLYTAGWVVVLACIALAVLSGMAAGLKAVLGAAGAAKRRRFLFNPPPVPDPFPPIQDVNLPPHEARGRRIVIMCDGTSNRPDRLPDGESTATNIWKLSEWLRNDDSQTVWYEAGVGSDSSSTAAAARRTQRLLATTGFSQGVKIAAGGSMLIKLLESGFGIGISETIVNGYQTIVRLYQPGDRIYLIGFSRGAFAARCIAGVISRCGLLRAEHERFAPDVVQIYRTRPDPNKDEPLRLDMAYPGMGSDLSKTASHSVAVECIGVFDTVASLGFPLWGWWFRFSPVWRNIPFSTDPAKVCRHIYHALSMDERRAQFFPTLFTVPEKDPRPLTLEQVWFRGVHADVGGGYDRHDVADIPLRWMMDALRDRGLEFMKDAEAKLKPNQVATLHDELVRQPTWNFFGSWPRWHPVPGHDEADQTSVLHPSVLARARAIEDETGRPDLKRIEKPEEFVVNTNRPWFRTGLIIESHQYYRLTYLGGLTRDAEDPPAGPAGQTPRRWDVRRLRLVRRRLQQRPWMYLAATVAHPRTWTPQEKKLWDGLKYLFIRSPRRLLAQIAQVGEHLRETGQSIYMFSEAPSGLLYFFVNDLWQTAGNNSGGPHLRIEPVNGPVNGEVLFRLTHKVETMPDGRKNQTNNWIVSTHHGGPALAAGGGPTYNASGR